MKKIAAAVLATAICFSLTACGGGKETQKAESDATTVGKEAEEADGKKAILIVNGN